MPIGAEWMDRASTMDLQVRRCLLNGITCGDAFKQALFSATCKLNGASGTSQSGKTVKVFPQG